MNIEFTHTLEIGGHEYSLTVQASYFPHTPGTREDPPEDESVEIDSFITTVHGEVLYFLTASDIEILEAAALDAVSLEYEKYHEAELEHRTNQYDFD